jgi:hypothetical protein
MLVCKTVGAGPSLVKCREPHHSVFCSSPHSLHLHATRTCPGAAKTRFGAPHFPHMASIRVFASFTKRSVSSRIDCFDISRFLPLQPPRSYKPISSADLIDRINASRKGNIARWLFAAR